ncbi:hypothetical protein BBJ29_007744 [Phytophthora kernoviae]|uniref:Uncharacterized protein n=1 Tax=Phytophthora kernoviae TaxID=325452 RepID=A0A3F2RGE0_9STRA|nr:hypothetical protein BBP00_00008242 [Phytophthora kernoviae]RLN70106.1 hypothetical protein BBJ29_007744 [Phytophthora kernoviae]
MRQRTKSVVNVREYFRLDGSGAPEQEDDDDNDDWMAIAMMGSHPHKNNTEDYTMINAKTVSCGGRNARDRASTVDSLADTDDDTDDEDDGILRVRACSHDRRISFDLDVNVVEIPPRSSFDADYKRRVCPREMRDGKQAQRVSGLGAAADLHDAKGRRLPPDDARGGESGEETSRASF